MLVSTLSRKSWILAALTLGLGAAQLDAAITPLPQVPVFLQTATGGTFNACRYTSDRDPKPKPKELQVSFDFTNDTVGAVTDTGEQNSGKFGRRNYVGQPTIDAATYPTCGVFTIRCHVRDTINGDTADITNTVTVVGTDPAPTVTLNPTDVCIPATATGITATASAGTSPINWTITDQFGNPVSANQTGDTTATMTFDAAPPGITMNLTVNSTGVGGVCPAEPGTAKLQVDYNDVPPSHPAHDQICKAVANVPAQGCTADHANFCPDGPLTKQLAGFMLLTAEHRNDALPFFPEGVGDVFADVPDTDEFSGFDEALWEEGIADGCVAPNAIPPTHPASPADMGLFCPTDSVTRGQMAAALVRVPGGVSVGDCAVNGAPYDDVLVGDPYCNFIDALKAAGFTNGCGDNNFCPENQVTRAQAADFFVKLFTLVFP